MDQRFVFVQSAAFQDTPRTLIDVLTLVRQEKVPDYLTEPSGAVLHIVGLRLAPGERIDLLDMADILLAYFKAPSMGEIQRRLGMPLVELSEDREVAHITIRSVLEVASAESFPIGFLRAAALREFRVSAAGPALQTMLERHVELARQIAENRAEREDVIETDVSVRSPAPGTDNE